MSFNEKTAWIGIVSLLGLIVWYFWPFIHAGNQGNDFSFFRLALAAAVIIFIQNVVRLVVSVFTPKKEKTPPDEREKMIETNSSGFRTPSSPGLSDAPYCSEFLTRRLFSVRICCSFFSCSPKSWA